MTSPLSPFASASVTRHLARGVAGLIAFGGALSLLRAGGLLGTLGAVCLVGFGIVLLRGCPMCWVIGLIDTVASRTSQPRGPVVPKGERL